MSKPSWTPEPWFRSCNEIIGAEDTTDALVVAIAAHDVVSGAKPFSFLRCTTEEASRVVANLDRIATCVNACKGLASPAAELMKLRAEIKARDQKIAVLYTAVDRAREFAAARQADTSNPMVQQFARLSREMQAAMKAGQPE